MTTIDELYTIERGFWEQGRAFYEEHCADDVLLAFTGMAGTQAREEVAASAAEDGRWKDVEMQHKGLVMPMPEIAVITYEATATRADGTPHHALVSSGYVWQHGDWKLMFHGQASLGDDPA